MSITWFHLTLLYVFINAASKLLQKFSVMDDEVDPTAFSSYFQFVGGLMTIPFLLIEPIQYPKDPKLWLILLLSCSLYTICMILFFKALKTTEISQVETIATTRTIWLMLFGVIFFKESLYTSQFVGVFLIFFGLIIIYWQRGAIIRVDKPQVYTLLYAILISLAYALDKYLLNHFSIVLLQLLIYTIPGVLTALYLPNAVNKLKVFILPKKSNYLVLLCCFLQMLSTLALYWAYSIGDLSLVGPLAQSSILVAILAGLIIFKERWNLKRKLFGISLAVLGIVFIRFIVF